MSVFQSFTARPGAARWIFVLVVALAFASMLRLNLPGHLSVDSVMSLYEGRFEERISWQPAIYGWVLGLADRITPGTALAVALNGALLFGSWAALAALRPRVSWLAPLAALGLMALPQAMVYPGIVWKDVLFAGAATAGFVLLAWLFRAGPRRMPWVGLGVAALLFALAGLVRQNGLILAPFAALALVWIAWPKGRIRAVGLAGGWLATVAILTLALGLFARPTGFGPLDDSGGRGLRIVETYDLVGAAALQPGRPMPSIEAVAPRFADRIRQDAAGLYSPVRMDTMVVDAAFRRDMRQISREVMTAEWLRLIAQDTGLYLRLRADVFRWVFATPVIDRCLPVHLGVEGPPDLLARLEMPARQDTRDVRLYNYTTWFLDTPAMSHVAYAAVALLVAGLLLVRRDPADVMVAALLLGSLAVTASFFVISLACDYRYLYQGDIAAITGALHLAADPRLRRRQSPSAS